VVICPSNPYLSIDPILALPALRAALCATAAPVVAVTPLIGAAAVKGPTAKLMRELGIEVAARAVLRHYAGLIDGFVFDAIDAGDAAAAREAGRPGAATVRTTVAATLMTSLQDRERLARDVLQFANALGTERQVRRAS
jgi:LPPG:FO 2-phospho-L-lactate transferase